jgi:DNA-binding MarR family transcriptional regulator
MPHTKAGKVFTALVLETFRFNGRLLLAGDRLAKPLGLTSARWQVLGAIGDEPLSVARIARNMGLARQNVQRLADVLQMDGIVHYAANPEHKRAKLVGLTPKGRRILEQLTERQALWANHIAEGASAVEIQSALEVIRKLMTRLDAGGVKRG